MLLTFLSIFLSVSALYPVARLMKDKKPNRKLFVPIGSLLLFAALLFAAQQTASTIQDKLFYDLMVSALLISSAAFSVALGSQLLICIAMVFSYFLLGLHRNESGLTWGALFIGCAYAGALSLTMLLVIRKRWSFATWLGIAIIAIASLIARPHNLSANLDVTGGFVILAMAFAWLFLELGRQITRDLVLTNFNRLVFQLILIGAGLPWLLSFPLCCGPNLVALITACSIATAVSYQCFFDFSKRLKILSMGILLVPLAVIARFFIG